MLRLIQIVIFIWVGIIPNYSIADTPAGRLILIETNRIEGLLKHGNSLDNIHESKLKDNCLIYFEKGRMSFHDAAKATASWKYSVEITEDGKNYTIYNLPKGETRKTKLSAGELILMNASLIPANQSRTNLRLDPPNTHYFATKGWPQQKHILVLESINLKH